MIKLKDFCQYLSIVLVLIFISGCKTNKPSELVYKPLEHALLWQINGPGISKPSYLYGTIHIIGANDYFLPKGTMAAIEASKKVVFEIDMNEMTDISKIMGLMKKVMMKDGKTLKDLISNEEYTIVSDHFKKMGLPIFMLERMQPMLLTVFAYGDMDPSGLKSGHMKSYEMEFFELSKSASKTTGGLESIDFQIGLFDEIPYENQAKMLVEAIKSSDTNDDGFKKMTEMYVSQNIDAMVEMISQEENEIAGYEDKLLYQRNKNWIPLIIEAAKKEETFFAVGAGHLGGPIGVIHLLRRAGMKVTPVK
ncbi:MAG: TraB/GumN family protein [Saprospiraceae bacterium]|nr:TraB/GumN family protein [Saprospiraceae bacterium]